MRQVHATGLLLPALLAAQLAATSAQAAPGRGSDTGAAAASSPSAAADADRGGTFHPEAVTTEGAVEIGGRSIAYRAVAGTLVVHPRGWDDAAARDEAGTAPKAEASMFYTAYFRNGAPDAGRPITFLFNGGPGSASLWLHMGAFGPRRVVTADAAHTPAAPYRVINNAFSLLDASDLVFIDAPATGFSRIAGKDKEKAFLGVDADAHAFTEFVKGFLSKYDRWNSPKYLFGESYGTPRAAVMTAMLAENSIELNGVILLSATLNFDLWADAPQFNPGTEEPYIVTLPSMAATAWYHDRISGGRPAELAPFLREVEQFALTDYAQALLAGSDLAPARRKAVAERLAHYTGLPVDYIEKADLRVNVGEFQRTLDEARGLSVGRLDTRFEGPQLDPLSKEADYDPQSAAIGSAYVTAFNDYARRTLKFGGERAFRPSFDVESDWAYSHRPPGAGQALPGMANVMPDLATAMKLNPRLRVLVTGGQFDLATPYFEGIYETRHLAIPADLRGNIEYRYYPSGHMVYANEASLKALHADVADFMQRTAGPAAAPAK